MTIDAEHPLAGPAASMNVLLVEDDASFAHMMASVFSRARDQVIHHTWAASLQEALAQLRAGSFDIILLDLMLDDSRGLDTVRAMRATGPIPPIVVLTGLDSREMGAEALRLGADDYLVKGGEPAYIIRALRNTIERQLNQRSLMEAQQSLRAAEAALIRAEKMESVGRLAAGVAHEVKNPLSIIQMGLDALGRLPGNQADLPAGVLRDMADAVGRARGIINGLLNFSQPEKPGRAERVDLAALMEEAARAVVKAKGSPVRIDTDFDAQAPPLLLDRRAIRTVFDHLILNAVEAMPGGGTLRLSTGLRRIETVGDGAGRRASDRFTVGQQVVTARVADTGPGIPAASLAKVFDPFFTTKPQGVGTGLGLFVCRNIMNLHGGRITVENAPAGGAVATLTFVT